MRNKDDFKINVQLFAEEDIPVKIEEEKEEPQKPKVEQLNIDLDKITKTVAEKLKAEKDEEIASITKSFEEKLLEIKAESKEKEDNYSKLIEGLKADKDTKDIIKEIEEHNADAERSKELKEALELKVKMEEEANNAKAALEELKAKMAEKETQDKALKEQLEFKAKLLQESKEKPYIADKINKILEEEDFNTQKTDYRTILKFFDTDEEKERFEAKKRAGTSAFKGVKTSDDEGSDDDLKSFNKQWIEKRLKEAEGRKNPNRK